MALYAIGDIQGCDAELGALLTSIKFSADRDRLWFVGDLVNRGPQSLQTLRRIRALGDSAAVVLGNHDLHLLAVAMGAARTRSGDTLTDILNAPDRHQLLEWLRHRPLLHEEDELRVCMLHAGLPPQWDMSTARACAREFESALRQHPRQVFDQLYGDEPALWSETLDRTSRLRFIANCFTRVRYVDTDGRLALHAKKPPRKGHGKALVPWFDAPGARWRAGGGPRIVFGHWSTLGFHSDDRVTGMDTGCVWGGKLTALRLDHAGAEPVQVACKMLAEP